MCCVIFPAMVHKTTGQVMSEFRSVRFWLVFSFRIGNISAGLYFVLGRELCLSAYRHSTAGRFRVSFPFVSAALDALSVQWPTSPRYRAFFQCSGLKALTAGRLQRRGFPSTSGFCSPLRWRPRRIEVWGRILYGPLLPA
jgi:hypothetical protein